MKKSLKKKKRLKKLLCLILATFALFILILFFVSAVIIGNSVKKQCLFAKASYQKPCVKSLELLLEDEKNSFRLRNSAIWAIGQLGDKNALPVLKKYYTGNIKNRESLDRTISQYELSKAIKLLEGEVNITAFIWRYNID